MLDPPNKVSNKSPTSAKHRDLVRRVKQKLYSRLHTLKESTLKLEASNHVVSCVLPKEEPQVKLQLLSGRMRPEPFSPVLFPRSKLQKHGSDTSCGRLSVEAKLTSSFLARGTRRPSLGLLSTDFSKRTRRESKLLPLAAAKQFPNLSICRLPTHHYAKIQRKYRIAPHVTSASPDSGNSPTHKA